MEARKRRQPQAPQSVRRPAARKNGAEQITAWIRKLFPHAVIVAAGMLIVFFVIDKLNRMTGFMSNGFHKWLTLFLALAAIGYAVRSICAQRKAEREAYARRLQARRAAQANAAVQRTAQAGNAPAARKR